ncbi:hypothetical protein GCU67_14675 [Modestobacter muralis]|uniref:BatC protein n=1 Tax=Modestobacter muralis TaxID=1608614 RepID=A0A6P0EXT6_9ACTN|nr:hypothetical protein [Modestobacter muralis]NEK95399.1 hypothetical protein [Modestobacter muralis]NEN52287.1 hypothetical protein [Modestobacter muralis]
MNIRRPVAALFVALALVGGPATMTACSAAGGGTERNDGDSSDNETANTGGSDPGGTSQGNLPSNQNKEPDGENESGDDEGNNGGDNSSDG